MTEAKPDGHEGIMGLGESSESISGIHHGAREKDQGSEEHLQVCRYNELLVALSC